MSQQNATLLHKRRLRRISLSLSHLFTLSRELQHTALLLYFHELYLSTRQLFSFIVHTAPPYTLYIYSSAWALHRMIDTQTHTRINTIKTLLHHYHYYPNSRENSYSILLLSPQDLFYSRKNYKRPELQISPHRAFEEEVTLLDSFFPGK